MRLFWNNRIDAAGVVITATREDASFPAANVVNEQKTKRWRDIAAGGSPKTEAVTFDLGSALQNRAFLVLNHDLLAGDTDVRIQANSSDSWGSPAFDQLLTHTSGVINELFDQTYRYWRFTYTVANESDLRNIGRLFLGDYYDTTTQPGHNGFRRSRSDQTIRYRSPGGQTWTLSRPNPRRWTLDVEGLTDAEEGNLRTVFDAIGTHKAFFLQVDPNESGELGELLYVKLVSEPELQAAGVGDSDNPAWDVNLELEEAL